VAKVSITGINIATTQGTVTLHWTGSSSDIDYYNVYKAVPTTGLVGGAAILVPPSAAFGFIGNAYGEEFVDTNIIADFTQSPPSARNPLANGRVVGFNITAARSWLRNRRDSNDNRSQWCNSPHRPDSQYQRIGGDRRLWSVSSLILRDII
jgi:hypothetical protein